MAKKNLILKKDRGSGTALLVIDVQQGLFTKPNPVYKAGELLTNICTLIERAHQAGTPVFFIQHSNNNFLAYGSDGWQLHPQLSPTPGDIHIYKLHPSSFESTPLEQELDDRGVGRLIVTGMVTHGCVRATCLDANQRGFRVVLIGDGHSSFNKDARSLIEEWNQKLTAENIEVRPTAEVDL